MIFRSSGVAKLRRTSSNINNGIGRLNIRGQPHLIKIGRLYIHRTTRRRASTYLFAMKSYDYYMYFYYCLNMEYSTNRYPSPIEKKKQTSLPIIFFSFYTVMSVCTGNFQKNGNMDKNRKRRGIPRKDVRLVDTAVDLHQFCLTFL